MAFAELDVFLAGAGGVADDGGVADGGAALDDSAAASAGSAVADTVDAEPVARP